MAYRTIANYGTENAVEVTCRAKDIRGARACAIRWLNDNGTQLDSVMILSNGYVIGRVFPTPRKYLLRYKKRVALYMWEDPVNGMFPLNAHGRPRTFLKN